VPSISGRVVKELGLMLLMGLFFGGLSDFQAT
jgi:hypothetical protein